MILQLFTPEAMAEASASAPPLTAAPPMAPPSATQPFAALGKGGAGDPPAGPASSSGMNPLDEMYAPGSPPSLSVSNPIRQLPPAAAAPAPAPVPAPAPEEEPVGVACFRRGSRLPLFPSMPPWEPPQWSGGQWFCWAVFLVITLGGQVAGLYFFNAFVIADKTSFKGFCSTDDDMDKHVCFLAVGQFPKGLITLGQVRWFTSLVYFAFGGGGLCVCCARLCLSVCVCVSVSAMASRVFPPSFVTQVGFGLINIGQAGVGLVFCIGQGSVSLGWACGQVCFSTYAYAGQLTLGLYRSRYAQIGYTGLGVLFGHKTVATCGGNSRRAGAYRSSSSATAHRGVLRRAAPSRAGARASRLNHGVHHGHHHHGRHGRHGHGRHHGRR